MILDQMSQMTPEMMQMFTALGAQHGQRQQASLGNQGMPNVKPTPSFFPAGQMPGPAQPGLGGQVLPGQGSDNAIPPQVASMVNSLQSGGVPAATGVGVTTPPGMSANNFSSPAPSAVPTSPANPKPGMGGVFGVAGP